MTEHEVVDGWWWVREPNGSYCIVAVDYQLVFFTGDEVEKEIRNLLRAGYVFITMIPEPV
ncbi:MAG: hypothetical protein Q7T73_11960 [Beijerinckiaceae bacterium]|nr:hypothetical protein [Beijerinckiaceae bacterium]